MAVKSSPMATTIKASNMENPAVAQFFCMIFLFILTISGTPTGHLRVLRPYGPFPFQLAALGCAPLQIFWPASQPNLRYHPHPVEQLSGHPLSSNQML